MPKTILIIEDDNEINSMLRTLLRTNGFQAVSAFSGTEGVLVHGDSIDRILLDLMLPGRSGDEIVGELKRKKNVPIIVMSAIHDIAKKVDLFSLGADDYITKPFDNDELIARITARLRSSSDIAAKPAAAMMLTFKNITLDPENFHASCNGRDMDLSRHEYLLLQLLVKNHSRTCTKSMIYDTVWDYENSADDNTLNVHISKLRKKPKECDPETDYIETVWGIGYRLKK